MNIIMRFCALVRQRPNALCILWQRARLCQLSEREVYTVDTQSNKYPTEMLVYNINGTFNNINIYFHILLEGMLSFGYYKQSPVLK